jgi:uncharacterized protein (UPF0276 family)
VVAAVEDVVDVGVKDMDRFGVTWHPSIAASVLAHRDRLDLVEVIPEGRFLDSKRARRALRRLARVFPVSIHGVSLGLASVVKVDSRRLDAFARLVGEVEPESWSEHLAFVRAGGVELGHLAAPSRTTLTAEATAEQLELARRFVGSYPCVENVATPIDPPGSDRSEETWLQEVLRASPANLLLDLHNLYTNGKNCGFDPKAALMAIPASRIRVIHIAGGADVQVRDGSFRRVDDHLHDVPDPVYELLELVGEYVPTPVDVILERDGAFPRFDRLVAQIDRARTALARGRSRAASRTIAERLWEARSETATTTRLREHDREDQAQLECFLACLYTDEAMRKRFLSEPFLLAKLWGLSPDQTQSVARIDRHGLHLAAASFARKKDAASRPRFTTHWSARLLSPFSR